MECMACFVYDKQSSTYIHILLKNELKKHHSKLLSILYCIQ